MTPAPGQSDNTEDEIMAIRHYSGDVAHEFRRGDPVKVKAGYDAWFAANPSFVADGQIDGTRHYIDGFVPGTNRFDMRAYIELAGGLGRTIPPRWLDPVEAAVSGDFVVADPDAMASRLDEYDDLYLPRHKDRFDAYLSVAEVRTLLAELSLARAEVQRLRTALER